MTVQHKKMRPGKKFVRSTTVGEKEKPENGIKLTKQQKRDIKRNLKSQNSSTPTRSTNNAVGGIDTNEKPAAKSVYKREVIYPCPVPDYQGPKGRFLTPADADFQKVLNSSYVGFIAKPASDFLPDFHSSFRTALEGLDRSGVYQFDVTQPGGLGTKTAKTFVTRCLVGEAGITYKYLGLRMFAIPWNCGAVGASEYSVAIGELNDRLVERSRELLCDMNRAATGSCQYNLTLINRCFPATDIKLKNEPSFGMDKCTVSWHADSSLEHYSSVAVYHVTSTQGSAAAVTGNHHHKNKKSRKLHTAPSEVVPATAGERAGPQLNADDQSWRVALRVWPNAEGPTAGKPVPATVATALAVTDSQQCPPHVAVPLTSGSTYYLLDDFNHHHQHSVLAGNSHRYGSTHRVSRVEGHTYQWLLGRYKAVLHQVPGKMLFTTKQVRAEQLLLNDIEFEWIRQFYIQGSRHRATHTWWHNPMNELLKVWAELGHRTETALRSLRDASTLSSSTPGCDYPLASQKDRKRHVKWVQCVRSVTADTYDVMMDALKERHEKRQGWLSRENDGIFATLPADCRPIAPPFSSSFATGEGGSVSSWATFNSDENAKDDIAKYSDDLFCSSYGEGLLKLRELVHRWKVVFCQRELQ